MTTCNEGLLKAAMWKQVSLIVAFMSMVAASKCNMAPSLWCSNRETAENCGVLNQCIEYLTPDQNAEPVNFSLYYESLCPGCRDFIKEQLYKTYLNLGENVMNLSLVPYGNAEERKMSGGGWKFECQHGKMECVGNLIETCALYLVKNKTASFEFIHCMEGIGEYPRAAKECAPKFSLDYDKIMACANGNQGNQLEHEMALITSQLSPPHEYVPWVTLNGVHTNKIQDEAMDDLMSLICDAYKGPKPDACKRHKMLNLQRNRCTRH